MWERLSTCVGKMGTGQIDGRNELEELDVDDAKTAAIGM